MSAVVDAISDVVGGIVEAVGDVVESVVDVVQDVGRAIDDYVIQPILDDPLSAIATVAAATFLGPAAAAYFGTSAAVGVGIAAGAANTAAGLVQGEDFDDALKGGLMAGVGAGVGAEFFGPGGGDVPAPSTDVLGDFLAANNNFVDVPMDALAAAPSAVTSPVDLSTTVPTDLPPMGTDLSAAAPTTTAAAPSPLETIAPPTDAAASAAATPSPLQSLNTNVPQVEMPTFTSGLDTSFNPDYSLTSGMQSGAPGLKLPDFTPADSFDLYGNANYSLTPPGTSGGPGLQLPDAPNLTRMGGGQGLTVDVAGLPEFQYSDASLDPSIRGQTDTWQSGGKTYGAATPDVTVSQTAITPTPTTTTYDATTNMGTPSVIDQITSGNLVDAAKTAGSNIVDWTKNANPWVLGAGALAATSVLGGAGGPPSATPPPKGSTQDKNFNKSLDLYEYMRDKANYGGDLTKYGQVGQSTPGEHQFFQNTKFVPVPIPGQPPTPAKMGGLIQMKHFAQGGQAQGMQDPRRAQMMAAMAQQRPAGQGGPQGMPQGRPPMMQGGAMPGRPMMPQNAQGMPPQGAPQGMQQGRPQMPQRPRDPKTAYYQYGNPPTQAKAMGGLSQVHSMKIGGGADGRSDDVNAVLSDGEYVMDAESVAMLGNGSSKAGAAKLDQMRSKLRQHKGKNLASGKISPNAKSPLSYLRRA
jgi:hypothetical protein